MLAARIGLRVDRSLFAFSRSPPRNNAELTDACDISHRRERRHPAYLRRCRAHFDAVDGAGRNAEFTACAFVSDYRVHVFRRAKDRIDGTRLDAFRAADTGRFINPCNRWTFWHHSEFRIDRFGWP